MIFFAAMVVTAFATLARRLPFTPRSWDRGTERLGRVGKGFINQIVTLAKLKRVRRNDG